MCDDESYEHNAEQFSRVDILSIIELKYSINNKKTKCFMNKEPFI